MTLGGLVAENCGKTFCWMGRAIGLLLLCTPRGAGRKLGFVCLLLSLQKPKPVAPELSTFSIVRVVKARDFKLVSEIVSTNVMFAAALPK